MNSVLRKVLVNWDGTHVDYLAEIYAKNEADPVFFDEIIALYLKDTELQVATSWLIKLHYDQKKVLSPEQVVHILSGIYTLEHWGAQLHILQIIPRFQLDAKLAENIEPFVRKALDSETKFVKAAAYEAYVEIVMHFPGLKDEFVARCKTALQMESASVKVKVRRALKKIIP